MAIATDDAIHKFGTQIARGGTATAAITTTSFSTINATTGSDAWTNADDAPMASVTILVTYGTTAVAGEGVNLYLRPLNIEGTNDANVPDAVFQDMYVTSFPLATGTAAQYITRTISLPNAYTSQVYELYLENGSTQSISAGWDIYVTPLTIGGAA